VLKRALIEAVESRARGRAATMIPGLDLVAFTRRKVEPMVLDSSRATSRNGFSKCSSAPSCI
jgi:hypothetical protein